MRFNPLGKQPFMVRDKLGSRTASIKRIICYIDRTFDVDRTFSTEQHAAPGKLQMIGLP